MKQSMLSKALQKLSLLVFLSLPPAIVKFPVDQPNSPYSCDMFYPNKLPRVMFNQASTYHQNCPEGLYENEQEEKGEVKQSWFLSVGVF